MQGKAKAELWTTLIKKEDREGDEELGKKRTAMDEAHQYDDIMNLPHHVSTVHTHMSLHDRAAQFLPFAALTGYEDAIKETGRLTQERITLSENEIEILNERLHILAEKLESRPKISVTYFVPDEKKRGGAYDTIEGYIKRIDEYRHILVMTDGLLIAMEDIIGLDGEIFADIV